MVKNDDTYKMTHLRLSGLSLIEFVIASGVAVKGNVNVGGSVHVLKDNLLADGIARVLHEGGVMVESGCGSRISSHPLGYGRASRLITGQDIVTCIIPAGTQEFRGRNSGNPLFSKRPGRGKIHMDSSSGVLHENAKHIPVGEC